MMKTAASCTRCNNSFVSNCDLVTMMPTEVLSVRLPRRCGWTSALHVKALT